jgi:DNA topoisomerase 6 subunit A-like protein/histidine kinase/DNA gyrase B/HSP90-like ATPase
MDARADFQNLPADFSRSGESQTSPILKFERADWALFRTIDGLQQKAGVPAHRLRRLVLKELADNALDEAGKTRVGQLPDGAGYFVEDDGGGIDPDEVARLFSIARPLVSTKLLRLPIRGALGNGLRVVAGAVLASGGTLTVITRNRRIELRPEYDGTTTVVRATEVDFPIGTRVEICFGPALPVDSAVLAWAQLACDLARGSVYAGRSSPWWYDGAQFHELLCAAGSRPVRELIASLDGCTGATAGVIVAAAKLTRTTCNTVKADQATALLAAARHHAKPVTAERLGAIGADAFAGYVYVTVAGVAKFGSVAPVAEIPFVVECWAAKATRGETRLTVCVNRTPITGEIYAARDKREIDAFGCGLRHTIAQAPIEAQFVLVINIMTPHMPITSDGKEPNLRPFLDSIAAAAAKAVKKAHRPTSEGRITQKDIVLDHIDAAIADVSGGEGLPFNQRQLLYVLRPIVRDETGKELTTPNFNNIITDYENEHGEIPLMYREPRGSIYHPHRGEMVMLGTLSVENYERPQWTFNKVVFIEKEGWVEALKAVRWPERHDCMLMSSKGFTTRAARDLVDKLAEHDEPVTIFCVHDADAYGTMIHQTFQEATKARDARKIRIINLGLEPWEAVEMGLQIEGVDEKDRRKPVADYVCDREDGEHWDDWLQAHRVELNAMTTPQFIEWLDGKMASYAKLIPPADVLEAELNARVEDKVREAIVARILREANVDGQVAAAITAIAVPDTTALTAGVKELFKATPDAEWRDHIEAVATELAADPNGSEGAS